MVTAASCIGPTNASLGAVVTLIAAIATLLAMISLRNSDLATRCRQNNQELVKLRDSTASWRVAREMSLSGQNERLCRRYQRLCHASLFSLAALFFVGLAVLVSLCHSEQASVPFHALLLLSGVFLVGSIWELCREFSDGIRTLEMDCASARP